MYRYNSDEDATNVVVSNDQDSIKLQEEISKASEELSRIYGSLVWIKNIVAVLTKYNSNVGNIDRVIGLYVACEQVLCLGKG